MTPSMPLELSDAAIERMLEGRAGGGSPANLVPDIVAAVATTPQRRGWSVRLVPPRLAGRLAFGLAAAAAIAGLALAASLIGSSLTGPLPSVGSSPSPSPAISATPTGSGAVAPLPSASDVAPPTPLPTSPSPGGSQPIIVEQFGTKAVSLFTLDPTAGKKTVLGTLQRQAVPNGQSIHWSTDHRTAIVFADGDTVLAAVDVEQKTVAALPRLNPSTSRDAVSPAGDRVARLEDNNAAVLLLDLQGRQLARTPLPDGSQPLLSVWWAPDGTSVLVSTCLPCDLKQPGSTVQVSHLLLVPFDGTAVRDLAQANALFFDAGWSPDLSTIVFTNTICPDTCSGGVATLRLSDGRVSQLTNDGAASPVWSPDGRRIAFSRTGDQGGIWLANADGTGLIRLTTGTGDFQPRWSPDGAWVLFGRGSSDTSIGDLWLIPSSGGTPRLLVRDAVADW